MGDIYSSKSDDELEIFNNQIRKIDDDNIKEKIIKKDLSPEKSSDKVTLSKDEYEMLKKIEDETLKLQRCDFALIVNSGTVLPTTHSKYNNGRIKIEIFDIHNNNIEIEGKKYTINSQILFNKIKTFISDNLNVLIDWSKKETNFYLDRNAYEGGKSENIKIKYGQLLISVDGQVIGDIGKNVDMFINDLKELILNEIDKEDRDYMLETISNIPEQIENELDDDKLKIIIENVTGSEYLHLNIFVYDILKKIIDLPSEITTTIADLINYNPNEKFIDPLTQGKIWIFVKEICKKLNIELEENKDYFGGIAYYYKFKKVNNDDEFEKYCKLYEKKFGKKAYIPESYGTKEFTIKCIKKCLQENRDFLDELYYSKDDVIY